jgi:hypothetical protein
MAKPRISEHDLWLEGSLRVVSADGIVLNIPVSTTLPGALSPAMITMASQQLETVLDQLLINPATVTFNAHIESALAARKAESEAKRPKPTSTYEGLFRQSAPPSQGQNPGVI